MSEFDVYDWIHNKHVPKVQRMCLGEIFIYYLVRRNSGAERLNLGPSNLKNIVINDRLEEFGIIKSNLDTISEDEIRKLALKDLQIKLS
jgi:hypothetical protein